ncbi:MAG TPA: alpha/beta fold hydrolase [Nakamurella sp.]|nr:alpha/beta fold hydrolase [Nakamurella sp.]
MTYPNPSDRDIVEWLPRALPDRRIRYGTDPLQFGDLRLPRAAAPEAGHPVVVVLHGGGYSPNWNLDNIAPLAEKITDTGNVATWNLEYRRPGQVGGGWPGTWLDIANGIDHLRAIAGSHRLDVNRVVAIGHSAGATFAAWAAARPGIDRAAPLFLADPLPLRGVVSLAGILNLATEMGDGPEPPRNLTALLTDPQDGSADGLRARLASVSPVDLVGSTTVPQRLIVGTSDAPEMVDQTREFAAACSAAGIAAVADYLEGANHFDVIDPSGPGWQFVAGAITAVLGEPALPG